jgi:hypothetical protein
VFLIQYESVPAIRPLIDAILRFDEDCIRDRGREAISAARVYFRQALAGEGVHRGHFPQLTERGLELLSGPIAASCRAIRGSYFGMLQGQWPLHLLRRAPLPPEAFDDDLVLCRVHGNDQGEWSFVPIQTQQSENRWFELEFSLPTEIAELVERGWGDRIAVAQLKQQHFSFIDLTGVIGNIRRSVRLQLDPEWIDEYINRQRRRGAR